MALLGTPVDKARTMVLEALKALGADPTTTLVAPDTWFVAKGSAGVRVQLLSKDASSRYAFLQVSSPVMKLPPSPEVHQHLLKLNFDMGGLCAFTQTPGGEVHLTTGRTIDGLSAGEVQQLVGQVAHFSDLHDNALLAKYGRQHAIHCGQR
jgi:hypothetical protein